MRILKTKKYLLFIAGIVIALPFLVKAACNPSINTFPSINTDLVGYISDCSTSVNYDDHLIDLYSRCRVVKNSSNVNSYFVPTASQDEWYGITDADARLTELDMDACVIGCTGNLACNDGDECTNDICNNSGAYDSYCSNPFSAPRTVCETTNICDGAGNCVECLAPSDCNDGNVCTEDTCVSNSCVNDPVVKMGDICDTNKVCDDKGNCLPTNCSSDVECDGGDTCKIYTCDKPGTLDSQCLTSDKADGSPCGVCKACQAGGCVDNFTGTWNIDSETACLGTCGGAGTITRVVTCSGSCCDPATKPLESETCTVPYDGTWSAVVWGACTKPASETASDPCVQSGTVSCIGTCCDPATKPALQQNCSTYFQYYDEYFDGNELPFSDNKDKWQCCSIKNSCVDSNKVCYAPDTSPIVEIGANNYARCHGSGRWINSDYHSSYCSAIGKYWHVGGSATGDNYEATWGTATNVSYCSYYGPVASQNCCCGDDDNEFYRNDGPGTATADACCNASTDCVDQNGNCVNNGIKVCYNDTAYTCNSGSWSAGTNCGVDKCSNGICVDCTTALQCNDGDTCTADSCSGGVCVNTPIVNNWVEGAWSSCTKPASETAGTPCVRTRTVTCPSGCCTGVKPIEIENCSTYFRYYDEYFGGNELPSGDNVNKWACCSNQNSCVGLNQVCYAPNTSPTIEIGANNYARCYSNGKWINSDYTSSFCSAIGKYWHVGGNATGDDYPATWGDATNVNNCSYYGPVASQNCCCGDDDNEFYRNDGPGTATADACCAYSGQCVTETGVCVSNSTNRCVGGVSYTCNSGSWSAGTNCNDGNACTTDTCSGGTCVNTPINVATVCNDSNACTTDTCSPASGCVNTLVFNGIWSYGDWSACSASTCGTLGIQTRSATCSNACCDPATRLPLSQTCSGPCAVCPTQTKSWGTSCSASVLGTPHGLTRTVSSVSLCYTGSATYQCNNGTWVYQSGTCSAKCPTAFNPFYTKCMADGTCCHSTAGNDCSTECLYGTRDCDSSCDWTAKPNGTTCTGGVCINGSCCQAETNTAFCARIGKTCGSWTAADNCGTIRFNVNCGSCSLGTCLCNGTTCGFACSGSEPYCWGTSKVGCSVISGCSVQTITANGCSTWPVGTCTERTGTYPWGYPDCGYYWNQSCIKGASMTCAYDLVSLGAGQGTCNLTCN